MNCDKCDLIFSKIKDMRETVDYYYREKEYYNYRLGYVLIHNCHRDTVNELRIQADRSFTDWIKATHEQKEIHLKLSRHYKKHLDGRL